MVRIVARSILAGVFCAAVAAGDGGPITGTLDGQVLAAGDGRVMILSPKGEVTWEQRTALTHDAWLLPNGNVLLADGATVTEVAPDKKVVFQYKAQAQKGGGTYACQRLENGNTMVGENSTGRVLEVDPAGKVVFELQTKPAAEGNHHNMRMARKLANGNYLVCHSGEKTVKEYTPKGDVVLEIKVPNIAFAAIRTAQNTTLVASLGQVAEFDKDGKEVWKFANNDIPGVTITNMTGMHLLPNGNLVIGCYQAYNKEGQGCGLFEITRDKKLVWRLSDRKIAGTMMAVQKLSPDGKRLPGECLR